MKFDFDLEKCSDVGLVVKHGNKDNVVLFFDEFEDASIYRATLFRTEVAFAEGFIQMANIISKKYEYRQPEGEYAEEKIVNSPCPTFIEKKLVQQVNKRIICKYYKPADFKSYSNSCNFGKEEYGFDTYGVIYESFDKVKYITQIESQRNDLYINIDFLPCGHYFVVLHVENRNGEIIKTSVPYYFNVLQRKEPDNKELIDAIQASGKNAVYL